MENRINIGELLKDCPEGIELYSPLVGDCKFVKVNDYESKIIVELETGATVVFQTDGRYFDCPNAECILFPKGKTTWEGFVPPCKFKDGDVLVHTQNDRFIMSIYKSNKNEQLINTHAILWDREEGLSVGMQFRCYTDNVRFATKEEKEKLFKAIKDYGYKWNEETKTLEKLFKPWTIQDAKDGDVLAINWHEGDDYWEKIVIFKKYHNEDVVGLCVEGYGNTFKNRKLVWDAEVPFFSKTWTGTLQPATKEQRDFLFQKIKEAGYEWNPETKTLEKLVKPKFEVGNRIKMKGVDDVYAMEITEVTQTIYTFKNGSQWGIESVDKDYELAPNKFDITTLKPFESKVLMRSSNAREWVGTFYSHYNNNKFYGCGMCCEQCIPYEGNEHLIGKTDDCNEYFKIWE